MMGNLWYCSERISILTHDGALLKRQGSSHKHIQNKMELIQNNLEPWQVEWLRPLEQLESNHNLATTLISTLIRTSLLKVT